MAEAYPIELRLRVVRAYEAGEGTYDVVANLFKLGSATVKRWVDGTFAVAKKGGPASAKPSAARGPRSWQWQTALVFLSPFASKVLRPTK